MPRVLLHSGLSFFVSARKRSCAFRNTSKTRPRLERITPFLERVSFVCSWSAVD
uniref:Uncharacterized protein n=1 Tax=Siphoviridae sp. ctQjT5 TaxID=2827572 RepID=A0A8S5RSW6_9CAUD|nr:MAG TPA: hypothetical protein [Siphoviridae sp. ctQjT5]